MKTLYLILLLTLIIFGCTFYPIKKVEFGNYHHSPKIEATATKADVVCIIARKSIEAQIDPILSLRIAFCESSYDPKAQNKTSSAKGLYQFVNKTWQAYCKGDPLNAEDNLNCFIKLYPQHSSWWKCKG